jgi:hypothetical protein
MAYTDHPVLANALPSMALVKRVVGVECYFSTIQAQKLKSLLNILLRRGSSTSQIGMKYDNLLRSDFHLL